MFLARETRGERRGRRTERIAARCLVSTPRGLLILLLVDSLHDICRRELQIHMLALALLAQPSSGAGDALPESDVSATAAPTISPANSEESDITVPAPMVLSEKPENYCAAGANCTHHGGPINEISTHKCSNCAKLIHCQLFCGRYLSDMESTEEAPPGNWYSKNLVALIDKSNRKYNRK